MADSAPQPTAKLDPLALRAELEALHPACFGWALACTARRREDAQDVLQAAYERVLSGEARFEGRASLKSFLFGVIRVCAKEHARRRWLRWFGLGGGSSAPREEPAHPAPSAESALAEDQRARAVSRAVARLPERQREVLHLVFYEELTVRDAAAALGLSVGTASVHYDRGKKNLAALLRAEGIEA